MIQLFDVNLLIALADPRHVHAQAAFRHLETSALRQGWATCPLSENGFLRIFGGKSYPGGPGCPQEARRALQSLLVLPGHQFWADDLSLSDARQFPNLPASMHLTDYYLLALAVHRGGVLVTFDKGFDPWGVPGGDKHLRVLTA
ncbi:MAG: TA system VapC family ribonuclease toxin [Terrimicrobiaceae bacterium]